MRWRNRAAGSERRDGQVAALQADLYGVGDPRPKSISSLWRTAMKYYVCLDVAMKEATICIVDDQRRIVREGKAATEPEAIAAFPSATGTDLRTARHRGGAVGALAVRRPGRARRGAGWIRARSRSAYVLFGQFPSSRTPVLRRKSRGPTFLLP
jgi:hypothetical protein